MLACQLKDKSVVAFALFVLPFVPTTDQLLIFCHLIIIKRILRVFREELCVNLSQTFRIIVEFNTSHAFTVSKIIETGVNYS